MAEKKSVINPADTAKNTEDLVTVFIPRENREDTQRFIAVNGERIIVQTGKAVQIPRRFAEVIQNSLEASAAADEYIDSVISK